MLPLLLIGGVVMGLTLSRIYNFAASNVQQRNLRELSLYASRIGGQLEILAQVARSTASFVALGEGLSEREIYGLLGANVQQHALITGSAVAFEPYAFRPDNQLFAPYVHEIEGRIRSLDIGRDSYDYRDGSWEWYSQAARERRPRWSEAYFDLAGGNQLMTTHSAPIERDGHFLGVATIDVPLALLQQQAERELTGQNFAIVGRSGRFLAHYAPQAVMVDSLQQQASRLQDPAFDAIVADIVTGLSGFAALDDFPLGDDSVRGDIWLFHTPIEETGWHLITLVPEAESTAELRSYLIGGSLGLALTFLLASGLVWVVSIRLSAPIRRLEQAVSEVARGKLDTPIGPIRSLDELGRLSIGFNQMLRHLKRHIEREGQEAAARQVVEKELEVARETQQALLPRDDPPFPDHLEFELFGSNRAARHVGGDFFDYFLVNPNTLMFVIADVSGKGVPAALVMAVTRTIIRNLGLSGKSPAEILAETNALLVSSQKRAGFVTVFLACYDIASGTVRYANAGHPPPFRLDPAGGASPCCQATGTIIGMLQNQRYFEGEIRLRQGDSLVLYTDGISEARDPGGEFYGRERFQRFLAGQAGQSPRTICLMAIDEICTYQDSNLADDITILVLRRARPREPERKR